MQRNEREQDLADLEPEDYIPSADLEGLNNPDNVNQPSHYEQYSLETIKAIKGQSTHEEFNGWLKGNIIKYIARYQFKNGLEDLYKAQYYLNKLITEINDDEVEE